MRLDADNNLQISWLFARCCLFRQGKSLLSIHFAQKKEMTKHYPCPDFPLFYLKSPQIKLASSTSFTKIRIRKNRNCMSKHWQNFAKKQFSIPKFKGKFWNISLIWKFFLLAVLKSKIMWALVFFLGCLLFSSSFSLFSCSYFLLTAT